MEEKRADLVLQIKKKKKKKKQGYSQEMYHKRNSIILEAHINVASDPRTINGLPRSNDFTSLKNSFFFPPSKLKGSFSILPRWPFDFYSSYHSWLMSLYTVCIYIFIYIFIYLYSGRSSGYVFPITRIQAENVNHSITVKKKNKKKKNY